jgi:hypothetical protein
MPVVAAVLNPVFSMPGLSAIPAMLKLIGKSCLVYQQLGAGFLVTIVIKPPHPIAYREI